MGLAAQTARAVELDFAGLAGFRTALSSRVPAREDGGASRLRFGAQPDGDRDVFAEPSEVAVEATLRATDGLSIFVHAQYQPEDDQAADIVRGFVQYERAVNDRVRAGFKGGAYFPGVSKENRGVGWTSTYTLTNSAGFSWLGEEVRPVGARAFSSYGGDGFSVGVDAGFFFANDVSGEALAFGGFALNDIKTPLNGRVLTFDPANPGVPLEIVPFQELDNRPGYQVGLDVQVHGIGAVSMLYWDNNADLAASRPGAGLWDTRFFAASGETVLPGSLTLLPSFMTGTTENATGAGTDFTTAAMLLARDFGPVRLAARGEYFDQDDLRVQPAVPLDEQGAAVTVAASGLLGRHHQFIGEVVHIRSDRDALGPAGQNQRETLLQAEYRFIF